MDGIESVRKNSSKDAQYTRKQSTAKQPYFILSSANGEIIGSSQMYASGPAMESGIASVKENGATKTSKDNASKNDTGLAEEIRCQTLPTSI